MPPRPPLGPEHRSRVALAVVALGILGLLGFPRQPPTALELEARRRSHALRLAREELLGAIEEYRLEHESWPGVAPEGGPDRPHGARWLREQLLQPTDVRGRLGASSGDERYPFGPYLHEVPANPLDGSATLHVIGREAGSPTRASAAGGWVFDPRTGTLRSNAATPGGRDA